MTSYKIAVLVCMFTVFATSTTTIFADEQRNIKLSLDENIESQLKITVTATYTPDDGYLTAKLINSENVIAHMVWYKMNSDELTTTFTHTFTNIDKIKNNESMLIEVEYDGVIVQQSVNVR